MWPGGVLPGHTLTLSDPFEEPPALNNGRKTTHSEHHHTPVPRSWETAQSRFSRQRRKKFTDLSAELLGGRENAILEVRAEVDANLLLTHVGTEG